MIEIICGDDEEKYSGNAGRIKYDLPKNIRQVGNAPGEYKIYIEDYVMTYLRKIAAPGNINCRGAVLLGKVYNEGDNKVLFISGAVDAQNLEFDISMIKFSDSIWSGLYAEINKYFDDLSIVGWFLSRMGFSTTLNDQMKKLHRDNFPGDGKVLFLMDSLECEETFYYYSNGCFVRERGYYIYYVRNERMQNYIISRKCGSNESAADNVIIKDKTVVENFRDKGHKKNTRKQKKKSPAAAVAALCAVALGTAWCVSPESFSQIADRLHRQTSEKSVQVFMNSEGEYAGKKNSENVTGNSSTDDVTEMPKYENTKKEHTTDTSEDVVKSEQTSETTAQDALCIYQVEAGDTLVSISIKMYGSQEYAEAIAEENGISTDSPIYEGEKLVIPYAE